MNKTHAKNENDTEIFAKKIAKTIKNGDVLCIFGNLGAGKTVFAREIIRFLSKNINLEVPSPTFTLVQTYETDIAPIFHFDLYRIEDPEELFELGWEEALSEGISIIEWPEKAGHYLPSTYTSIHLSIDPENPDARYIDIKDIKP